MKLILTKYYEVITEESAEQGDFAESGEAFTDECTVVEAIRYLRDCSELSQSPVTVNHCAGVWATTTDPVADRAYFERGESRYFTYHLKHIDGRELTSRQLFRIYRAAGLAKGRV